MLGTQHSHYRGPGWGERKRALKKIFEEITAKNLPKMGKEIVTQDQEPESHVDLTQEGYAKANNV